MPVYEGLIETGGRGTSRALIVVYFLGFTIIFTVFVAMLAMSLGIL